MLEFSCIVLSIQKQVYIRLNITQHTERKIVFFFSFFFPLVHNYFFFNLTFNSNKDLKFVLFYFFISFKISRLKYFYSVVSTKLSQPRHTCKKEMKLVLHLKRKIIPLFLHVFFFFFFYHLLIHDGDSFLSFSAVRTNSSSRECLIKITSQL